MKRATVIVACLVLFACGIFGQAGRSLDISTWNSYQKANFFMTTWQSEKQTYDSLNAIQNKPEDLVKVLETRHKALEDSRIPIRAYATLVNGGGTPDATTEQQIVDWLRELQVQLMYSGGAK